MAATSFNTTSLLSFQQWLDNRLCNVGQGYFNATTRLYYQNDPSLDPSMVAYASPFRAWVHDSGVSGAVICNGVSGSIGLGGTGQVMRGQSGLQIDYPNGRILLPASVGKAATISGTYAVKEMNVYFSNQNAEKLVFTDKYYLNSRFNRPITGIPPANEMVTPCIIITDSNGQDTPWAFGGVYDTQTTYTAYVFAENLGQLESTLSLIADAKYAVYPQLDTSVWPLNASGDLKSGYNYSTIGLQYGQPDNLFWARDIETTKFNDHAKVDQSIFLGAADIHIHKARGIH